MNKLFFLSITLLTANILFAQLVNTNLKNECYYYSDVKGNRIDLKLVRKTFELNLYNIYDDNNKKVAYGKGEYVINGNTIQLFFDKITDSKDVVVANNYYSEDTIIVEILSDNTVKCLGVVLKRKSGVPPQK